MNSLITQYQKDCFANYKQSIGYPENFKYITGAPINVLVPIETPISKYMVIGAYPSAKFYTINGITDVPGVDNDSPFSDESYFDGSRVRVIPSGRELNEVILKKIAIQRSDCWITDLVKVFLFKEGHIERYVKLGKTDIKANRDLFDEYAMKSLHWIEKEVELCDPSVILLLGIEVTKVFFEISERKAYEYLDGKPRQKEIKGINRNIICLPHPGILMKPSEKNPWPSRFENEISVYVRKYLMAHLVL